MPHGSSSGVTMGAFSSLGRLVQVEGTVQRAHRQFHVLLVDDDGGLDLAGGDHLDVDALLGQRAEHFGRDTHVAAHADADDGDLADLRVAFDGPPSVPSYTC